MCGRKTRSDLSTSNPKLLQINNRKVSLLIIMQKYVKQDLIIIIIYAKRHRSARSVVRFLVTKSRHEHTFTLVPVYNEHSATMSKIIS